MENVPDVRDYVANYELNEYSYQGFWSGREYEHAAEVLLLQRLFRRYVPNAKARTIIDLGGAYGRLLSVYGKLFRHIVLADYSTRELREGMEIINKSSYADKVSFVALNAYRLPYQDNSLDSLLSVRVMHHLKDLPVFFEQLERTLVPGGIAIIEFANKNHILALLRNILKGNMHYIRESVYQVKHQQESSQGMREGQVAIMYNFSTKFVKATAQSVGLEIQGLFACSFLRVSALKKWVPIKVLVFMEQVLQSLFGWLLMTPSVFIVLKKGGEFVPRELQAAIFQCPTCGAAVSVKGNEIVCVNSHSFPQRAVGVVDLRDPRPEQVDF